MDWPVQYQKDPAFALLRPLLEVNWLASPESLTTYLQGQARRLGKSQLFLLLRSLNPLAGSYKELAAFLAAPTLNYDLNLLKIDIEQFLRSCFSAHPDNPWQEVEGLVEETGYSSITEDKLLAYSDISPDLRRKLIDRQIKKRGNSWKDSLKLMAERQDGSENFENSLLEEALLENPNILAKEANADGLAAEIFTPVDLKVTVALGSQQVYNITTVPVLLGKHYLSRSAQNLWFSKGQNFTRIIGSYARWDNAKVLFFRKDLNQVEITELRLQLKQKEHLALRGPLRGITGDKTKLRCALVVNKEIPEDHFSVYEWAFNTSQLEYQIKGFI